MTSRLASSLAGGQPDPKGQWVVLLARVRLADAEGGPRIAPVGEARSALQHLALGLAAGRAKDLPAARSHLAKAEELQRASTPSELLASPTAEVSKAGISLEPLS